MGKARQFLPVLVLFFLVQRAAIGQQPLHWDATIDSAKAAARQSNRLVLVLFSAPWCTACHHLESDIRDQPGAAAALEANFVPVKINYDYYPNTAKQYGVTRLPTTVILAPNPQGDVLAVIPERMPVDQYLLKLNKVADDAKRRAAGVFAQIQPAPPVGAPAGMGQPPAAGIAPPVNPIGPAQAMATPRSFAGPVLNPAALATTPGPNAAVAAFPAVVAPPASAAATNPMVAMATEPGLSGSRPLDARKPAENIKPLANPPFGLDGFCPVQLVENSRWQPGKKAWGVIHRGRTYLFAGAEEQRRFRADPDRYAPVSSGDDVVVLLEQGRSVSGCREHGLQFDGHVYLFAEEGTLDKFRSNPRYYADRALHAMRTAVQTAAVR
jgi:protein disulfide-isomerase